MESEYKDDSAVVGVGVTGGVSGAEARESLIRLVEEVNIKVAADRAARMMRPTRQRVAEDFDKNVCVNCFIIQE